LTSFAEARAKVLPKLAGLRLGESTVERATEAAGARLGALLAAGQRLGPAVSWGWHKDARGQTCAYVSVDATGVGRQGRRGSKVEGRMAYVGQVYNPRPPGPKPPGPARPSPSRYLAGLYDLPELAFQLRRQAGQVGMDRAEQWVVLTDGGNGLEERLRVAFPRAAFILDFWHAAQHLHDLAKARYPQAAEQAQALAAGWCHRLKHEGGSAVLAELEGLDRRGWSAQAREAYRLVTGYVRDNVGRMDYPTYRQNGWLIGSGHIEAACKDVIGARLKGSGMRWSEAGADAVCHLRALFKSEAGQWQAFWATAA
jgi:hypothetical protein